MASSSPQVLGLPSWNCGCNPEEESELDPVFLETVDLGPYQACGGAEGEDFLASDFLGSEDSVGRERSPKACGSEEGEDFLASDFLGSEDSVGRARSLRRCSLMVKKALSVDRDIMRGISLKVGLRGLGQLWRFCPADLPIKERSKLWALSGQVESFDIFLSHSWHTPGRWKVVALTLRFGWPLFLACSFAFILLAEILSLLEILPLFTTYQARRSS